MDRVRVGVTWRIVAVWSSLSSDVRKCVNLESESGGCATAPVCPTAGECEKSITCAEVEKEAEVRVVAMAAGEMVGAKAAVEQEAARAVVEKEAVATVVVARAAARAEEERALEEESGERGVECSPPGVGQVVVWRHRAPGCQEGSCRGQTPCARARCPFPAS